MLTPIWQRYFEALAIYLDNGLNATIPLTFMLGFFVSFVVSRWTLILRGLGWIDNAAIVFATFIKENDDDSRMLKRNLIRYMVLNQALVLRDISMQVRQRFPTLETLVAAGLLTKPELNKLRKIDDIYSQYWTPIQWVNGLLYKAHLEGKIKSEKVLDSLMKEVQIFRDGISSLLRYDWVPIPLVYPQLIFFANIPNTKIE
uniref:Bestrophin homolog n=1 Tax=Acrobeloides nanus TaxID=290746 RepID=A0A914D7L5_9BILA